MKRFFTFLMAILALLSISQAVKAADCYIMGSFNTTAAWTKLDGQNMTALGGEKYTQEYKCTTSGEYRFRFAVGGESWQLCPHTPKYNLTEAIPNYGCAYTTDNGKGDNYFYVNMESGKTYTFTFDNSNASNRNVACKVSGSSSSSTENYAKFYLIGSMNGWNEDNKNYPFTTTDGKTYTCILSGLSGELYFKPKGFSADGTEFGDMLGPDTDTSISTEFQKITYKGGAWTLNASSNKTYTITLDYSDSANPQIKYSEGSSEVVTKVIKFLNGETEITGTNGKYTLDLSSATANATITLSIDGASYGLATAQTISAAGITSGIAFIAEGPEALTLKAGLIYYLSVTDDGKMTVVAKDNPYVEAGAGFYLVGDFMSQYNDKTVNPGGDTPGLINYERLYFKFDKQKDGSYRMDIPACLTAKMQIMAVNADGKKTIYGPTEVYGIHGDGNSFGSAWPATNEAVSGTLLSSTTLSEGSNYWNLTTRNDGKTDDDGMYKVSFTLGENGVPSKWTITHDAKTRVAYLISTAYGATAQPVYNKRSGDQGGYSNNTEAFLHFDGKNSYYAIGYVVNDVGGSNAEQLEQAKKATPSIHATKSVNDSSGTHDKLFFLGNGGYEYNDNEHNKVWANQKPFTLNITGNKKVQYNPNRGFNDIAGTDGSYGSTGSIYIQNSTTVDYPNTISMVGTAIPGTTTGETWNWASTAADMIYDANERCYKLTLETKDEHQHQFFRFVGDHSQDKNWYEDTTTETAKKAGCDHENTGGHTCYPGDENIVSYTDNGTSTATEPENGIMWNRAAGLHIVRFYITTDEDNKMVFKYSIESTNNITVSLTYRVDKFIRTYSNDVAMDIIDPRVKVYEAYKYTMPDQVDNIYSQGTLELRQLKYIPANMGVVLIGTVPATETHHDGETLNFSIRKRTDASAKEYVDVWTKADEYKAKDEKWNNFLVPTVKAINDLGNVIKDQNGKVTYRFYCLGNYYRTNYYQENHTGEDYIGFFRMTPDGISGANKAYLSLPTSEDLPGGKYGYIDYNGQFIGTGGATALAKMMLVFDDETSGVTEIKNVEENKQNNDNAYYTLQGIKVLKPTKGIFIHNGKKIVIK